MLKNFVPSTDKVYLWDFLKVAVLKCTTKEAMRSSFRRVPLLNILSAKICQNVMLRNFVQSIDKSYQWHFPKVVVLKHSTEGAMRSSFRRAPCT